MRVPEHEVLADAFVVERCRVARGHVLWLLGTVLRDGAHDLDAAGDAGCPCRQNGRRPRQAGFGTACQAASLRESARCLLPPPEVDEPFASIRPAQRRGNVEVVANRVGPDCAGRAS